MLRNIVMRDLKARYKGSVLGFLWTFFNPLLMLVIYSVVFSLILKVDIENYSMFIFVALLPWTYFSNSVIQGSVCLVQNAGLIKKIYFPREVFPVAVVLTNLVNYLLSLLVLIPALLFFGISISIPLAAFPIILIVQTLLTIAIVLIVSVATVYFRDLEHLLGVLILALFYLTPILFPLNIIPDEFQGLFLWNPFAILVTAYRDIFFYGEWPDFMSLFIITVISILFLAIASRVFSYLQRTVAEEI